MTRLPLAAGIAALIAFPAAAAIVLPVDFDKLPLGGTIVGPAGPIVEASIITAGGDSIGDINGRVQCPAGIDPCAPPMNPPRTIYTFIYELTPGVDTPNDPPFPMPSTVLRLDDVIRFALGFDAAGFTGVAGYSFAEAAAAFDGSGAFKIDSTSAGGIVWSTSAANGWRTGETITFFFQTTQPPSGPGKGFELSNGILSGSGAGPVPLPLSQRCPSQ